MLTHPSHPETEVGQLSSPLIAEATNALAADDVLVGSVLHETVEETVDNCTLCWSLIHVATATDTELCIATQKLHCCHCCQQQGCWTTNAYCWELPHQSQMGFWDLIRNRGKNRGGDRFC